MSNYQPDPVEVFKQSWTVYQDIIEHNYMFHREITHDVKQALQSYRPKGALRILDLGCGDASMARPLLSENRIKIYIGCDLSQPALAIAEEKLNLAHIPHKLLCDDMVKVSADQPDNSVDLVISSYAIHHLNTSQKLEIIQSISRILSSDGRFVLIDIFREPSEDRSAYMQHYMSELRSTWSKLSLESQKLVCDHATSYDFPETPEFYMALCHKLGLVHEQRLCKYTWHEAWVFQKRIF